MKIVHLTNSNSPVFVDDIDFERLNQNTWRLGSNGYAQRTDNLSNGGAICILMHRFVMNCGDGYEIDHLNRNKLDNQKHNLRICNHSQNVQRIPKGLMRKRQMSSRFKGVYFYKRYQKWCSRICISGQYLFLGLFDSESEAAKRYDIAAKKAHGEFAYTNFNVET